MLLLRLGRLASCDRRRGAPTMRTSVVTTIKLCFVALLAVIGAREALANDAVWRALAAGGQVVMIRHAITTPGSGDPAGMRLDDCKTQRNLTDQGRRHAREIGEAFRSRAIAVERVLSSPWCRCLETGRLAFGAAEPRSALANLFGRHAQEAWQVDAMRKLVADHRGPGNLVLVSHGSTISALTGISPAPAELVVLSPGEGGAFRVVGRVVAHRD
jgi:phosphohistidine phosphatase SixA